MKQQLLTTTHAKVVKDTSTDICLTPQKGNLMRKGLLLVFTEFRAAPYQANLQMR